MTRIKHETIVTIRMTKPSGDLITSTAILEQDPKYLKWNRIVLLGTRKDQIKVLQLPVGIPIKWELYERSDWHARNDDNLHITGTGIIRSIPTGRGYNIADQSIQKIAEADILNLVETQALINTQTSAQYWFLQRPIGWHPYSRRPRGGQSLISHGDWYVVPQLRLRFRLLAIGYRRNDIRISDETELLTMPAVEISLADNFVGSFAQTAGLLWFSFRILLGFRYRQYIDTTVERFSETGGYRTVWHPRKIEPQPISDEYLDPPFHGVLEPFLAKAAESLSRYFDQNETLHAAVFSYASSFDAYSIEAGLTTCIEAIERLVTAFEHIHKLGRSIVEKDWKPIGKALKSSLDGLTLSPTIYKKLRRNFASSPSWSLQDRIERMISNYAKHWKEPHSQPLLALDRMISCRNAIVHGRTTMDIQIVHIERIRAQALFEKLFICLVGTPNLNTSGWRHHALAIDGAASSKRVEAQS